MNGTRVLLSLRLSHAYDAREDDTGEDDLCKHILTKSAVDDVVHPKTLQRMT